MGPHECAVTSAFNVRTILRTRVGGVADVDEITTATERQPRGRCVSHRERVTEERRGAEGGEATADGGYGERRAEDDSQGLGLMAKLTRPRSG